MSGAHPDGGQNSGNNIVATEDRSCHLDDEEVSKLKSKMRDVSLRLNNMRMNSNKQASQNPPEYLSPFSSNGPLRPPSKKSNRSSGASQALKLDTTPEALNERGARDYVTSKSAAPPVPQSISSMVSPLTSPLSGSSYSALPSSQRSGAPAGGQAAEMQARILALQRSRSKQRPSAAPSSATASASSPQLSSLPRRSSSGSNNGTVPPNLFEHLKQRSSSRTSFTTSDNSSLESEDDDSTTNSSPGYERLDSDSESKPFPLSGEGGSFVSSIPSRLNSPNPMNSPQTPVFKQPLASNGFDPNTVISPTAASIAASGAPVSLSRASSFRTRQRSSLSARRGMQLDTSSLCDDKSSAGSSRRNSSGGPMPGSIPGMTPRTSRGRPTEIVGQQNRMMRGPLPGQAPQESGNRGLFRDYRKYIDIETGSLNFAGKACVHAQGIEFSSGEKFNISIDKLKFMCELGSGNYGTVQKVLHTPNGVFMAVKEIRLELDEASLRQIIMELDVLHRCEMKDIIAFYGAFFVEGSVYICMEYMDGGSINKIYEGGIPEKYLKFIVRSVVNGLKQLKEEFNIIHRDVKPTNILCSTDGSVKLCDFGVSGNLVASLARTNIGCQAYMAPERIKVDRITIGNPNQPMTYTAESDIWSLGLSIIEMAKGSYPYPSDTYASIFSQLNAIVEDPSPALDPSRYSPEACDFVNKLLSKSPEKRPKYSDIVKHPWLANMDCTKEEMGEFVSGRLADHDTGSSSSAPGPDQPTVTMKNR